MMTMSITRARANLAEAIDHARTTGEAVYLTRRDTPVVALVDVTRLDTLMEIERKATARGDDGDPPASDATELRRRRAAMERSAAAFTQWIRPGLDHPASASDLYASRQVEP